MRALTTVIVLGVLVTWCPAEPDEPVRVAGPEPAAQETDEPVEAQPVKVLTDDELESLLEIFRTTPSAEQQTELALTLNTQVKDRVDELLERIEKAKDEKYLQAIELAGFARRPEVTPVLLKLVASADVEAARRAVDALGVNGDPKAVQPLLKMLSGGRTELAGRAAIALGRIGDVSAVPTMLERLGQSKDLVLRLSLIRGVGLLKDKNALPTLERILFDSENPLEQTAVYDAVNLILGDNPSVIVTQLERIAEVLSQRGGDWQTQLAQAAVTDSLDRLIKEAEKSKSGQGKGKGKSGKKSQGQAQGKKSGGASGKSSSGGTNPASSSNVGEMASKDPTGVPGPNAEVGVVWGNLPPSMREEVTAALKTELPERYRRFLGIYYKILAEGK